MRCVIENRVVLMLIHVVTALERTKISGKGTESPPLSSGMFKSRKIIC